MHPKVSVAATCALLALGFAYGPAHGQNSPSEFPTALDETNLRIWLAARTNLTPNSVISIGSNSIIALRSVTPTPAAPGRFQVQIRAEVVNPKTAAAGGYLSWSADIEVDCNTRRSRAMGITNFPARDLKGVGQAAGGPSADWVTPTIGTQLYTLVAATCDSGFQRPLTPLVVSRPAGSPVAQPAAQPPAVVVAQAPPRPPVVTVAPAPPAAAPTPAPPPPAPPQPPKVQVAVAPPPAPAPPPQPPTPPKVQVAVAPPVQPEAGSDAGQSPQPPPAVTFAPAPPPPPAPPPQPPPRMAMAPAPAPVAPRPRSGRISSAAVQVVAVSSEAAARAAIARARQLSAEAAGLQNTVVRAEVAGKVVYRAIFYGFDGQGAATSMCQRLKAAGGQCFVRDGYGG